MKGDGREAEVYDLTLHTNLQFALVSQRETSLGLGCSCNGCNRCGAALLCNKIFASLLPAAGSVITGKAGNKRFSTGKMGVDVYICRFWTVRMRRYLANAPHSVRKCA